MNADFRTDGVLNGQYQMPQFNHSGEREGYIISRRSRLSPAQSAPCRGAYIFDDIL